MDTKVSSEKISLSPEAKQALGADLSASKIGEQPAQVICSPKTIQKNAALRLKIFKERLEMERKGATISHHIVGKDFRKGEGKSSSDVFANIRHEFPHSVTIRSSPPKFPIRQTSAGTPQLPLFPPPFDLFPLPPKSRLSNIPANSVFVDIKRGKHSSAQRRSTDKKHPCSSYKVGTVFSTATHEQHYDQAPGVFNPLDPSQTVTKFGLINSKYRKFIVVAVFTKHVIALPILTYRAQGLRGRERESHEYVSVRESENRSNTAPSESEHGTLWASLLEGFEKESRWHRMNDLCCLHLTAPYSHKVDLACTISGMLESESVKRLEGLYRSVILGA